jgi:hypothetical protein
MNDALKKLVAVGCFDARITKRCHRCVPTTAGEELTAHSAILTRIV